MKKLFIACTVLSLSFSLFAQDEEEEKSHKFRRDNIFIGGAIGLGASSGGFSLGANPEVGYSVARWLGCRYFDQLKLLFIFCRI
jgi:hypothetical protein